MGEETRRKPGASMDGENEMRKNYIQSSKVACIGDDDDDGPTRENENVLDRSGWDCWVQNHHEGTTFDQCVLDRFWPNSPSRTNHEGTGKTTTRLFKSPSSSALPPSVDNLDVPFPSSLRTMKCLLASPSVMIQESKNLSGCKIPSSHPWRPFMIATNSRSN